MKYLYRNISFLEVCSLVAVILILLLSGCGPNPEDPGMEFMPDMYRSPSYETYTSNPNFEDGKTARQPVEGTIPRGYKPYPYPNTNEGYEMAGTELTNPIPESKQVVAKGKQLYLDFCTHCHGQTGGGDGRLVQIDKFPPPPSFGGRLKDLPEGKMFHSITYGRNLMGSHSSQLTADERWMIIHYIKTLQ